MNTLLTALDAAIICAAAGTYLAHRRRARRHAARARYTAEAIHQARQRITHDRAARWLAAHDRAVQDGRCTADCPIALNVQMTLDLPATGRVMGRA